jgi:hypothetical protein
MYPYMLKQNPFPASQTARRDQSDFVGGRRWKAARDKIKESIMVGQPISVIVGPYGVGKTHLVFNLLNFFEQKDFIISYIELSGLLSGENPVIKAVSQLMDSFRGFREEAVRSMIRSLMDEGRLNTILDLNFSRFGAWKMRKKLDRYLDRGEVVRLSREEKLFLRDTVLMLLDEKGVDKGTAKVLLFSHSWKNILQTMDSAVNALSAMTDIFRFIRKDRIVIAFDELDILEQKSDPHDITESFRNLINNLPVNVFLIFAITTSARRKISSSDPGLYSRLDVMGKVCTESLENPDNELELFEVIKDILKDADADMDLRDEDELKEVCKLVFDKRKERPLRESLTLFNTLFESVGGDRKNIMRKTCELLGIEREEHREEESGEDKPEKSRNIQLAIINLCTKLNNIEKIKMVHERGKQIKLKGGGYNVTDVFFADNEGKWVAGEVKVGSELEDAFKLHIPEIMRKGLFVYRGEEKKVDRAILWYHAKVLSSEVESKIEELRREGKEVDTVKISKRELMKLKNLEDSDLEALGKRLGIIK